MINEEKGPHPTPHQIPLLSAETIYVLFERLCQHPSDLPPHNASVDFADRMIIDTRDYNHELALKLGSRQLCKQSLQF